MNDSGRKVAKRILALVAAVAPPTVIVWLTRSSIRHNALFALLALTAYELVVLVASFATSILNDVKQRWISRLADDVDAWLQRLVSRYTRAYLKYVSAANSYIDLTGLTTRGEYTLSQDEIFVSVKLESNAIHSLSSNPVSYEARKKATNAQSVWFWLERAISENSALAIIGPPGCGKTTLLKHIAYVLSHRHHSVTEAKRLRKIPVLIALRNHKEKFEKGSPTLTKLIQASISEVPQKEPSGWVSTQLRRNRFLIMLDGLDEIADSSVRLNMTEWAERQRSAYPDTLIVVTSRPFGYRDNPLAAATVLQVQPFTQSDIEKFLKRWYEATSFRSYGSNNVAAHLAARNGYADLIRKLEEAPYLLELSTNPLLLTMVANVHHYRGALPGSRSELYKEVCDVFLGKRHQARGVIVDMPASQKQAVLQNLAFEMMARQIRDVSLDDAADIIAGSLASVAPGTSPLQFLRRVEESSGLLIEREQRSYSFSHQTFEEYLASTHIRDRGLVSVLVEKATEPWWNETIRLYAAQADATPIINKCLSESVSNPYALALAVECANDAREVDPQTRSELNERLSPPDARWNKDARQTAGLVRMMLRSRGYKRISRDIYISPTFISCIEYQVFLDEQPDHGALVPDHWIGSIYTEGNDETPVTGIRYSDAVKFSQWLQDKLADGWNYRLPLPSELTSEAPRKLMQSLLVWPLQSVWSSGFDIRDDGNIRVSFNTSINNDDRRLKDLFRIRYTHEVSEVRLERTGEPVTMGKVSIPVNQLRNQIADDVSQAALLAAAVSLTDSRSKRLVDPDYLKLSEEHIGNLVTAWYEIRALDAGTLMERIERTEQNLRRTASSAVSSREIRNRLTDLLTFLDLLKSSTAIALNRAVDPSRRQGYLVRDRLIVRLCALACVRMCAILGEDIGSSSATEKKSTFISSLRLRDDSSSNDHVSTTLDFAYLAELVRTFERIYAEMAILEGRIEGRISAWEALTLIRSPNDSVLGTEMVTSMIQKINLDNASVATSGIVRVEMSNDVSQYTFLVDSSEPRWRWRRH